MALLQASLLLESELAVLPPLLEELAVLPPLLESLAVLLPDLDPSVLGDTEDVTLDLDLIEVVEAPNRMLFFTLPVFLSTIPSMRHV